MNELVIWRYILTFAAFLSVPQAGFGQLAGTAGAFARMGFGSRGIGMGNAMTAVISGEINSHYNPAVVSFAEDRYVSAAFGILSLDRSLNFLSYTQSVKPTAGIAVGIINSGVGKIDGRDSDGIHTSTYSTSENQFFLTFANRFVPAYSLGITVKLYHNRLFEDLSETSIGFDFGLLFKVTEQLTIGAAIQDLRAEYKWDTSELYGQFGNITKDEFPMLRRLGVAYRLPNNLAVVSADFENSYKGTNRLRFGTELNLTPNFSLRGGVDRIDPDEPSENVKPTFGFSIEREVGRFTPSLHYAYVFESFAPGGIHLIGLAARF